MSPLNRCTTFGSQNSEPLLFFGVSLGKVESEYWELIEKRHFPDTETGEALLLSVSMARETPPHELRDLERPSEGLRQVLSSLFFFSGGWRAVFLSLFLFFFSLSICFSWGGVRSFV